MVFRQIPEVATIILRQFESITTIIVANCEKKAMNHSKRFQFERITVVNQQKVVYGIR